MRTAEISRQHARIRSLLRRIGHHPSLNDPEMQAHWARYICVVTAGFVETSVRLLFGAYASQSSSPNVARYVESRLRRLQNPKAENLVQLAGQFDGALGKALQDFLDEDGRKEAIDTVMSNRHLVAHGRDSGITVLRIETYLARITRVIEFLEQKLGLAP